MSTDVYKISTDELGLQIVGTLHRLAWQGSLAPCCLGLGLGVVGNNMMCVFIYTTIFFVCCAHFTVH